MNNLPDYNPKNILKVSIDEVIPNDYNPKQKETKEYRNVVKSLKENGLQQPIMVREVDGVYVIVDGEQRYTAAKELGFKDVYIYNFGEISDEQAKSLTIWMEVQVPFDEIELAPLVVELNEIGFELPYTDVQIADYTKLIEFDFEKTYDVDAYDNSKEEDKQKPRTLSIKFSAEQFEEITDLIQKYVKSENVGEAEALTRLVRTGYENFESTVYIPETDL